MALVLRVLLIVQVLLQVQQVQQVRPVQQVRLHHLHYRVADPSAAMKALGGPVAAEPVILQGIGVGVRLGTEFVLFDRASGPVSPSTGPSIATAYPEIVRWLIARGFDVPADTARVNQLAQLMPGVTPDHVALSVDDLLAAVERVRQAGIRVTWRNDASATFRMRAGGPLVEFVRDLRLDQPDLYWCTMHPDVRSAVTGTCPFCKMALVPIPPPRIGEYRVDVTPIPAGAAQGLSGLGLVIRDPDSGAPVSAFATVHDKPLHLFVVGRALDYFAHLHPSQLANGTFEIRHAIPPGEYMVVADFLPQGGSPQLIQHAIMTPGFQPATNGGPATPQPRRLIEALADGERATEAVADGVRARIETGPITAGQDATVRFRLAHVSSNAPVSDLQPYLSAPAHLFLASTDLTYAVHGHPGDSSSSGPELSFRITLPSPGPYKLWLQVQRRGRVITLPFVVEAR